MSEEQLFSLKNYFYLGCYQQAISEALAMTTTSDSVQNECNFYMYRSYIEQGQHRMVLDELSDDAPMPLQAVKLLAQYTSGSRDSKDAALLQLKQMLSDPTVAGDAQVQLIAGSLFLQEQDFKEALKCTHQSQHLETMSLVVHTYLAMSRSDLAKKQVALMQQQDDDATLTKLASGWVSLSQGGTKCQDALYEFQELAEKYSTSLLILNGMALCNLHMGKFDEAERLLQEALSKNATDVNTLANLIVCMHHLHKPVEHTNRYMAQLKSVSPFHPWIVRSASLDETFDQCVMQLAQA